MSGMHKANMETTCALRVTQLRCFMLCWLNNLRNCSGNREESFLEILKGEGGSCKACARVVQRWLRGPMEVCCVQSKFLCSKLGLVVF